ncbi:MAG: hypothetical protein RLY87_818 [Chloroflexota bacterium]|jgi:cell wall-associated NlpC family hydrolase
MVDQSKRLRSAASDPYELIQRVNRRRTEFGREERSTSVTDRIPSINTLLQRPERIVAFFSQRMVMHLLVVAIIPFALVISKTELVSLIPDVGAAPALVDDGSTDFTIDVAPITDEFSGQGDAPLTESEDLPVPLSLVSRNQTMAPVVVPVTVLADQAYMRNGPGTNYDPITRAKTGLELQVIGKYGDWYQVRERVDAPVFWMNGELLSLPENAANTIFDIFDKDVPPPPPPRTGTVLESGLTLRDGPGVNYVAITTLKLNGTVELIEIYQDWYHIGVDSTDGWVKAEYIDVSQSVLDRVITANTIPDASPELVGYVSGDNVNLRLGPSASHAKIGNVGNGLKLDLIGKYKDWVQVAYDKKKAWIFKELLNTSAHVLRRVPTTTDFPALPVAPLRNRTGNNGAGYSTSSDVANVALQYVGYRYTWGGTSPKSGFDCSGLMMYAFRQVGVSIPRLAASQYSSSNAVDISWDAMQPGDMMFFSNTSGRRGITHVSMYIGGGKMVHAMTPTYGVQISNINDSYWVKHFYGAARVKR